jgi:hypothetical protein
VFAPPGLAMIRRWDYHYDFNRHAMQWCNRQQITMISEKRYAHVQTGSLKLIARRLNQSGKTDELSRVLRELRRRMTQRQMDIFSIALETGISLES